MQLLGGGYGSNTDSHHGSLRGRTHISRLTSFAFGKLPKRGDGQSGPAQGEKGEGEGGDSAGLGAGGDKGSETLVSSPRKRSEATSTLRRSCDETGALHQSRMWRQDA